MAGGTLRVVGLSDLGQKENPDEGIYYDDCYREDRDNYIDIILVGDEEAARNVTFVEIPALEGGYQAFYNPGGPGPEPFEGGGGQACPCPLYGSWPARYGASDYCFG